MGFDRPRKTGDNADGDQPTDRGSADRASRQPETGIPLPPKDAWSRSRMPRDAGEPNDQSDPEPVDLGAENYELRQKNFQIGMKTSSSGRRKTPRSLGTMS